MPSLIIFDVGHGSCAFLQDGAVRTLFDCKDASLFIEFLLAHNIAEISQVVISHADADHIAGISAIIQSDHVQIGAVYVNADAAKNSDAWGLLKMALQDAAVRKGLRVITEIGANMTHPLAQGAVTIEVVAPGIAWRLTGSGGRLPNGNSLDANSMSVVLRLHHNNHPVVLLPGDMDAAALQDIVNRNQQLTADILVFPHHGGNVSAIGNAAAHQAENAAFTADLMNRCAPSMVVFSIGRGIHATPRPEIVQQIRARAQPCIISCTQLSQRCHAGVLPMNPVHLDALPARGRSTNQCCAGSIEIQLVGQGTVPAIVRNQHAAFVANLVTSPICL
jgi:competence protein ComEC